MIARARTTARRALALTPMAVAMTVLLGVAADARSESFGRWFFSADERLLLDDARDRGDVKKESGPAKSQTEAAPVVDVISFDGKVERSGGGGSTVWVNGRPVYTGNRTAEGIRVDPSRGTNGETRFELPPSDAGATRFSLRAGQKVAVQDGRKFDAYEARPDEDAESVIEEALKEALEGEAPGDGEQTPSAEGGDSAARPASPGS